MEGHFLAICFNYQCCGMESSIPPLEIFLYGFVGKVKYNLLINLFSKMEIIGQPTVKIYISIIENF